MGMFILFILPGILAGLLLANGTRAVTKHIRHTNVRKIKKQVSRPVVRQAHPVKGNLYVYDLRQDSKGYEVA